MATSEFHPDALLANEDFSGAAKYLVLHCFKTVYVHFALIVFRNKSSLCLLVRTLAHGELCLTEL